MLGIIVYCYRKENDLKKFLVTLFMGGLEFCWKAMALCCWLSKRADL